MIRTRSPLITLGATFVVGLLALVACSSSSTGTGDDKDAGPGSGGGAGDSGSLDGAHALVSDGGSFHDTGADAAFCYPDNDGINGGSYTFDLTVDDTGFSKLLLSTQNDAQATVKLTNTGTKPHGFEIGCTTTSAPAGCPTRVCFPANATIAPLMPGETKTITFDTPTPDGILYPFKSTEPSDTGSGFTGQWSLM